ncbi:MAG: hypothetical protein EOP05_06755 [Proteobacteria bacterium]|nr:MAG: hypothetical protein EOP05_06755 [Pseudomonadota bacterium]
MGLPDKSPIIFIAILLIVVGFALDRHVRGAMAKQQAAVAASATPAGVPKNELVDEAKEELSKEREAHEISPNIESYEERTAPSAEGV